MDTDEIWKPAPRIKSVSTTGNLDIILLGLESGIYARKTWDTTNQEYRMARPRDYVYNSLLTSLTAYVQHACPFRDSKGAVRRTVKVQTSKCIQQSVYSSL